MQIVESVSSFEEFLQDYEAKEREEAKNFIIRFVEGKVSQNETFPPKDRFVNLKDPIAHTLQGINIWDLIPFYGSTIVHLRPSDDKKQFDELHKNLGFTSRDINNLIDLVKETGRIQFIIDDPTKYTNLDFLEPLFNELKPPTNMIPYESLIGHENYRKYRIEFETLAQFGFTHYINSVNSYLFSLGIVSRSYVKDSRDYNSIIYAALKALGSLINRRSSRKHTQKRLIIRYSYTDLSNIFVFLLQIEKPPLTNRWSL